MRVVHKWSLLNFYGTKIDLPADAVVRHVGYQDSTLGYQGESIFIWIEYNINSLPKLKRVFKVFATGVDVTPYYAHVGSVISKEGYVWHVYEVPPE